MAMKSTTKSQLTTGKINHFRQGKKSQNPMVSHLFCLSPFRYTKNLNLKHT
ncbi:hypothetical protein Bca101_015090 [Brassica carinata]